jgi:Kef-type K+ transport system membrane component KefB
VRCGAGRGAAAGPGAGWSKKNSSRPSGSARSSAFQGPLGGGGVAERVPGDRLQQEGPNEPGLGWVKPDAPVTILALVGLAFLLFLSGLEIDPDRLRAPIVKLTALGFAVSFAIAILIGAGLHAAGLVKSPLFVAIVLVATSLGVVFPVLKDSGNIDSSLGELVIAAASIADFGSIILLSLFFSGKSSTSTAGRLILLGIFGLAVVLTIFNGGCYRRV